MMAAAQAQQAATSEVHLQHTGSAEAGVTQLMVNGKPLLLLGGELGNSSASTAAEADSILPELAKAHVNTIVMPVPWEEIEPVQGSFDFSVLDHWIDVARAQQMHLVLLWFGSWKNGVSSYVPVWVKADPERFRRAIGEDGRPLGTLSTLCLSNVDADAKAFAKLMLHVREKDEAQATVVMVQVENEVGLDGSSRDRSVEANKAFAGPVPAQLIASLRERRMELEPEMASVKLKEGGALKGGETWSEVFGEAAPEVFMAWHYARYIQQVAAAGKAEYALPMYSNAQLPAPKERAGEYPSGGPHPGVLDVWRAGAPALDFFSPDIYWPEFAYWIDRYARNGNPVFVPEARLEAAPWNAFYAFGEAKAIGFSPFAIDSLAHGGNAAKSEVGQAYAVLADLAPLILLDERENKTRGMVLHANSPRAVQTVALGGYLFHAQLARSWPAKALLQDDGALMVIETGAKEFLVAGSGMQITITADQDTSPAKLLPAAEIVSVDEVSLQGGAWVAGRRLNGDQTNQGRSVTLPAHRFEVLRVRVQ